MNTEDLARQFNNELGFSLSPDPTDVSNDTIKAVRKCHELLPKWIKIVQEETIKEVLPEELSFEKNTNLDMTFHNHLMIKFQNAIHQEIIKKSRDNWGIIL